LQVSPATIRKAYGLKVDNFLGFFTPEEIRELLELARTLAA